MWAPFQDPITQSICYFVEKNIYCFNSCTSTFLDLRKKEKKKLPAPMNDVQGLESVALNFPI